MIENKDLQLYYNWFIHFDGSTLTPEIGEKLFNLKAKAGVGAFEQVKQIGGNLANMYQGADQAAEIMIFVALLMLDSRDTDIQRYFTARDLMENAANYYYEASAYSEERHYHYLAVFAWLRGYISWQIGQFLLPSQTDPKYLVKRLSQYRVDAINSWHYCVSVLSELCYSFLLKEPGWYQDIRWKVTDSIYETRRRDRYFAISKVEHWYPKVDVKPQEAQPSETKARPEQKQKRRTIYNIPIYQYVSAGGWGVVEPDAVAYVDIELEDIIIENFHYQAIDLRGKGKVTLREGIDYAIIKVRGTSMNLLNILDGDYVLIERQQSAEHMDIVLATLQDIDTEATLKRYYRQGKKIELQPVSNDPKNQVLQISSLKTLNILGIAIAVFKRKISVRVGLRNTEGEMLAQDLLRELLNPIVLFDMLYTQLSLINAKEYRLALEYDQDLAKFLNAEVKDKLDLSHVLNKIILEKNLQLQVLEYNKKLLTRINQIPIQIGKIGYASPLLTDIFGIAKVVEQVIDIFEKVIWKGKLEREKAEIELESLKHELYDRGIKDDIKSDLLEQELRTKTMENNLKELALVKEVRRMVKELREEGFDNDEIRTILISLVSKGQDFASIRGVELLILEGKTPDSPALPPPGKDTKTFTGE
ncbi:MAG: hypothetical protein H6636_05420 [Anaerolineales bacterium]|nr:hypothetical protein [Anaerolineales bacterium]